MAPVVSVTQAVLDPMRRLAVLSMPLTHAVGSGEVDSVLIVGVQPVMIEVHGDDVTEGELVHARLGVAGSVEDEGKERKRSAKTERDAGFDELPVVLLLAAVAVRQRVLLALPDFHDTGGRLFP